MFDFLKAKQSDKVTAPIAGDYLSIEKVSDQVFASKAVGDGFAINPDLDEEVVYSPIAGEVTSIFQTKHAITLKSKEGVEILIHLGIDTVELNGAPFEMLVEPNKKVKNGTPLVKVNWQQIIDAGKETPVIVVSTNSIFKSNIDEKNGTVNKETDVGKFDFE